MNLSEFCEVLRQHPDRGLRLVVEDPRGNTAAPIADHFHVTEVGRVEKRFVDCGGESRQTVACVLQTLVADDVDHRLSTTKLSKIMQLADSLDLPGDTPVEVEHQERSISLDQVASSRLLDGVLEFTLRPKQTACLAADACGLPVLGATGGECGDTGCC